MESSSGGIKVEYGHPVPAGARNSNKTPIVNWSRFWLALSHLPKEGLVCFREETR